MRYHLPFGGQLKLTFWGAAGEVPGSMHLVKAGGKRYLLDCGLHQGRRKEADAKNRNLPFDASSIDAVVLSHAHIYHSGSLPTLVKHGFSGPIYATPATIDLCGYMLRDTAHIQEKDAEFLNKRRERRQSHGLENGLVTPLLDVHQGADFRQHPAGRRNQPHAAEDPKRAARSHAGTLLHRPRHWVQADRKSVV